MYKVCFPHSNIIFIFKETNKNSLKFEINQDDTKTTQLCINDLNEAIQNATYKARPTQFILTIEKQEEGSWLKLKKTSS